MTLFIPQPPPGVVDSLKGSYNVLYNNGTSTVLAMKEHILQSQRTLGS